MKTIIYSDQVYEMNEGDEFFNQASDKNMTALLAAAFILLVALAYYNYTITRPGYNSKKNDRSF